MDAESYTCIRCGYHMNIPYDVLLEIVDSDILPVHLPNVVCPFCGSYLVTEK